MRDERIERRDVRKERRDKRIERMLSNWTLDIGELGNSVLGIPIVIGIFIKLF